MLVTGAMILAGAWFAYRALPRKKVLIPTALLGVGTLGVGIFPLTHPAPAHAVRLHRLPGRGHRHHPVVRVTTAPFRHLWTAPGAIALGATVLALDVFRSWGPMVELGEGGLERWIVYPIVLWLVAFGSYLLAAGNPVPAGLASPWTWRIGPKSRWGWCRLTCRAIGCLIGVTRTGATGPQGERRGCSNRYPAGAE
jgi:hypothetical protein